jgi:hypothetical protein
LPDRPAQADSTIVDPASLECKEEKDNKQEEIHRPPSPISYADVVKSNAFLPAKKMKKKSVRLSVPQPKPSDMFIGAQPPEKVDAPEEIEAALEPREGQWVALAEGARPWFAVVTDVMKDGQLQVHEFRHRNGEMLPMWLDNSGRPKMQKKRPRKFHPASYNVSVDTLIAMADRDALFTLPSSLLLAVANYVRDPIKS